MKVYPKRYAIKYCRMIDPQDPEYHPGKAPKYYQAHKEEIDFVTQWWARIRVEWERRMVVKYWRKHLTNEKS